MSNGQATPRSDAPLGFGPGGPLPNPSPWVSHGGFIQYLNGGVVIGNPTGGNLGPGTLNSVGIYVNGIVWDLSNYLPLSGGIISGTITVNGGLTMGPAATVSGMVLDMGTF